MPSLTGFGAPSTRSLASLRPRPVTARTTLIAWIFLSPAFVSTTSKEVFSSAAAAPSPPASGAPAAATATGAAALTPHSSSSFVFSTTRSRTVIPPRVSTSLSVSVLAILLLLLFIGRGQFGFYRRLLRLLFVCCWFVCLHIGCRLLRRCLRLRLRHRLALLLELADTGVDHPDQFAHRRGEQSHDGRQRRDHGTGELRAQHVGRRQGREPFDLGVADKAAV